MGAICFLCSPWIVNLTLTGLETLLFYTALFSFLLVVQRIIAGGSTQSWKSALWLGVTAGMLMLARTDAIFFTIPLFLLILFKKRLDAIRTLFVAGIVATLLLSPWLVWNIQQFHSIEQTSAIAMSALNQYSLPSIWSAGYWLLSCTFMLWVAFSTIVPLFSTYPPDYHVLQYSYISIVAFTCLLVLTLYRRSKVTQVIVPKTVLIPTILLIVYYFFIRFFVQIWHMSALHILLIMLLINYIPKGEYIRKGYLVAFIIFLVVPTFYSINNGYFHAQDQIIEQSEAYRSDL